MLSDKESKLSPLQHIQSILGLIAAIVGTSVVLFSSWDSIPTWGAYAILALVSLVLLIYVIAPIQRWSRKTIRLVMRRRTERQLLWELASLLKEARFLFASHTTCSLQYYVDSLLNLVAQDQLLCSEVRRLADRLRVLGDWHWSLLTFAHNGFDPGVPFAPLVQDIATLYRDTASVVRELADMRFPEELAARIHTDQRRMTEGKYSDHIGRVEHLLNRIAEIAPELNTSAFYRF